MTTDLDRLIEAVEAGEGNRNDGTLYRLFGDSWVHAWDVIDRDSLDAAVALCEALLPGWTIRVVFGGKSLAHAHVFMMRQLDSDPVKTASADSDTPARALLLATLRAYRSTREGG